MKHSVMTNKVTIIFAIQNNNNNNNIPGIEETLG